MSEDQVTPSRLEALKARAEKLGITVDGRWGEEKLAEVVKAAMENEKPATTAPTPVSVAETKPTAETTPAVVPTAAQATPAVKPVEEDDGEIKSPVEVTKMPSLASALAKDSEVVEAGPETPGQKKNRLRREAMALVRVRVSSMDPSKKKLKGELLCVSNKNFGTVQRYIPFNREWHIEKVLYDALMEKQYMIFDSEKTGRAGIEVKTPRNVPAFNIQVLPPLTKSELKDLAQRQAMADGTQAE